MPQLPQLKPSMALRHLAFDADPIVAQLQFNRHIQDLDVLLLT